MHLSLRLMGVHVPHTSKYSRRFQKKMFVDETTVLLSAAVSGVQQVHRCTRTSTTAVCITPELLLDT